MNELKTLLNLKLPTVSGKTVGDNIKNAQVLDREVIHSLANPVHKEGGIAILTGNLAPKGSVIKTAGVSPKMQKHKGPAKVYDSEKPPSSAATKSDRATWFVVIEGPRVTGNA
jgi:dihydroxy-acid dehydratase